jgi:hypothetical protein
MRVMQLRGPAPTGIVLDQTPEAKASAIVRRVERLTSSMSVTPSLLELRIELASLRS